MPTTNYMNPSAFLPNVAQAFPDGGPMAGIQYHNQMSDYNKLMGVQHFLQQLGAQRAQQEQGEFEAGAPIRALERQAKGETLQGQMPFMRDLAAQTAETAAGAQRFERETKQSPEAQADFFRQLKQKATDDQWKNYEKELTTGGDLVNEALNIQKTQGATAAMAYAQQQIQVLGEKGIKLPPQFADPSKWKALRDAAVQSIGHMQAMEKVREQGASHERVAHISAAGQVAAAGVRANNASEPRTEDAQYQHLQTLVFSGKATPEQKEQYKAAAELKWQRISSKDDSISILKLKARNNPAAAQELKDMRDLFMKYQGFSPATDNPTPPAAPSAAKPRIKFNQLKKEGS